MKLVLRQSDGLIIYGVPDDSDVEVGVSSAQIGELIAYDINASNADMVQVDDVAIPPDFSPRCYRYADGGFVKSTEGIARDEELLQQAVIIRQRAVDAFRDEKIAAGFRYQFPDGWGTAQVRNEKDMTTITGLGVIGLELVSLGDSETTLPFRDEENVEHVMNGTQMLDFGRAFRSWWKEMFANGWMHKDAIGNIAADEAKTAVEKIMAVNSYDFSGGWPE